MDLSGSAYLYAVASLAMTFVGFCAVVFALRQGAAKKSSGVHILHSYGYIEIALGAVVAAMLPLLLSVCGLNEMSVVQYSSSIIAALFAAHTWYIMKRFYATKRSQIPLHGWFNQFLTAAVIVVLIGNAIGVPSKPSVGPIAVAATWRLIMGVEVFLLTLEEFL